MERLTVAWFGRNERSQSKAESARSIGLDTPCRSIRREHALCRAALRRAAIHAADDNVRTGEPGACNHLQHVDTIAVLEQ